MKTYFIKLFHKGTYLWSVKVEKALSPVEAQAKALSMYCHEEGALKYLTEIEAKAENRKEI